MFSEPAVGTKTIWLGTGILAYKQSVMWGGTLGFYSPGNSTGTVAAYRSGDW